MYEYLIKSRFSIDNLKSESLLSIDPDYFNVLLKI